MTAEATTALLPPPPKRRFGLGTLLGVALLSIAVTGAGTLLVSHGLSTHGGGSTAEAAATLYQCPMHPTVVQDHPGNCPICGMKLVKVVKNHAHDAPAASAARRILFYRSPMDPKQTSPIARKDEMGMDYVPVYEDEVAGAPPVSGLAVVDIDPARQQLIGLKTTEVTEGPVGGAWRTVGRVAIDETRVRHINLKVSGFVEHVYVDFVGKRVKKGDPLFSIYSPDLLSAQEEYLIALKTQGAMAGSNDDLAVAARRKLALWDVPASEIARLAKSGEPTKTLTLYSPLSGVVTRKDVVDGMKLDAGAMPYEIVDLSSVWVLADVYESELRFVSENMPATLKLDAFPNREFKGKVVFIDPLLDPQTRTVKVRLTFPNPDGELRPEMFGEVVLFGAPREGLSIPADAVIDSGTEKVVFVAIGAGKFQPRTVQLGESDGSRVEVISGLTLGERVVIRANFLVDSESRLRASLAETTVAKAPPKAPESARVLPATAEPMPMPMPMPATAEAMPATAKPMPATAKPMPVPVKPTPMPAKPTTMPAKPAPMTMPMPMPATQP
ncbi:MAG TPA: efflux RND transporter periplasmic adaptor subunit [Polyangiaceae bacterium]